MKRRPHSAIAAYGRRVPALHARDLERPTIDGEGESRGASRIQSARRGALGEARQEEGLRVALRFVVDVDERAVHLGDGGGREERQRAWVVLGRDAAGGEPRERGVMRVHQDEAA